MKWASVRWQDEDRVATVNSRGELRLLPTGAGRSIDDVIGRKNPEQGSEASVPMGEVAWNPAVIRPAKIFCIGLNYRKHAEETGASIPATPVVFSKYANALTGHRAVVNISEETRELDYEAELAIIIGREASRVAEADALDYVFGYTTANDVSARDLQHRTGQWLLGKSMDGFLPLGPIVVTAEEIPDPNSLGIRLWMNGEERQHSNTRDMIFSCREIVSYLSRFWTLLPGDVILTGTPEGVINGQKGSKRWVEAGDEIQLDIDHIGRLSNTFAR